MPTTFKKFYCNTTFVSMTAIVCSANPLSLGDNYDISADYQDGVIQVNSDGAITYTETVISPIPLQVYSADEVGLNLNGNGDQRTEVLNTDSIPSGVGFNGVGVLQIPRQNFGHGRCTATLIAPNMAITAAHCFDRWNRTDPVQFSVIHTGLDGSAIHFNTQSMSDVIAIHPFYQPSLDTTV